MRWTRCEECRGEGTVCVSAGIVYGRCPGEDYPDEADAVCERCEGEGGYEDGEEDE